MSRRVVVTGRGVVSPLGIGLDAHWAAGLAGRSAIKLSPRLAAHGLPVALAAEIADEALAVPLGRFSRKQLKLCNRMTCFAMLAGSLAAEEASLDPSSVDPTRFGTFLGTFFTALDLSPFLQLLGASESEPEPGRLDLAKANAYCMTTVNPIDYSLKTIPNLSAGHLAIAHNAQGICRVVADAPTGGLQAIAQAAWAIREGLIDMALAGGAEAPLDEMIFMNLCTLGFLAQDGGAPEEACAPFDARRRGTVLGEGAGIVVLEELEHARARSARVLGELLGSGVVGGDDSLYETPDVDGIARRLELAMARALDVAEISEVDVIFANGDGTRERDQAESIAVRALFGSRADKIPLTAPKALHGHLMSAAGPVELITCLRSLEQGIIPPTLHSRHPDPLCDLDYVPNQPRIEPMMRRAMVNGIGLFGESASLVVGRGQD
ncbi:MAG: beta-ketoacyl-[acyl-carrier-protein] synthase family protein [Candidatus Methylomirabilia bacterium]